MVPSTAKARNRKTQGQTNMEWEEALLRAWGENPSSSSSYYRQKAARVREIAGEATTRAVKTRLLDDACHFDEIARTMDPRPIAGGGENSHLLPRSASGGMVVA
jgi:hypothetical protein